MSTTDPRSGIHPGDHAVERTDGRPRGPARRRSRETREELGETVAALTDKSDVKAQASAKADELKAKAQEVTENARAQAQDNPTPFVLGAVGALMVLVMLRKLRRRRRSAKLERLAGELAQRTLLVQPAPRRVA